MYSLDDLLRAQRHGNTYNDQLKAGTVTGGFSDHLSDGMKASFETMHGDLRRMNERTQSNINTLISQGGYSDSYSPIGSLARTLRWPAFIAMALAAPVVALAILGVVSSPDVSSMDAYALALAPPQRDFYGTDDKGVLAMANTPASQLIARRETLPLDQRSLEDHTRGHALWLRYTNDPKRFRQLSDHHRNWSNRLMRGYLLTVAQETRQAQPLIDLGLLRYTPLERYPVGNRYDVWLAGALAHPDSATLHALAANAPNWDDRSVYYVLRGWNKLAAAVGREPVVFFAKLTPTNA